MILHYNLRATNFRMREFHTSVLSARCQANTSSIFIHCHRSGFHHERTRHILGSLVSSFGVQLFPLVNTDRCGTYELKLCSPLNLFSGRVEAGLIPTAACSPRSAACWTPSLAFGDSCLVEYAVYMIWWMYDTCFCIHWTLCLAGSIGPWVICLYCVSDSNKDTIPLVSSCTCRWPRRAARQASCCLSSNRLPWSPIPFPSPSLLWVPLYSFSLCD